MNLYILGGRHKTYADIINPSVSAIILYILGGRD